MSEELIKQAFERLENQKERHQMLLGGQTEVAMLAVKINDELQPLVQRYNSLIDSKERLGKRADELKDEVIMHQGIAQDMSQLFADEEYEALIAYADLVITNRAETITSKIAELMADQEPGDPFAEDRSGLIKKAIDQCKKDLDFF